MGEFLGLIVSLFITCYNDTLFPGTPARPWWTVLERLGHTVVFPAGQTCCGQMHWNTGYQERGAAAGFAVCRRSSRMRRRW